MIIALHSVRLFQKALDLWVIGFLLSALGAAEWLWDVPVSPSLPSAGPMAFLTHAFTTWLPAGAALFALPIVFVLCLWNLFRTPRWWSAMLVWMVFTSLTNLSWLAGSGGQQLMSNLLFWNIVLCLGQGPMRRNAHWQDIAVPTAFWICRLQFLLAYATTGLHKLMGAHWTDGTALGIVVTDPSFGPAGLADLPLVSLGLTWAALLFQLTFPFAVWWSRTKRTWMLFGVLFHLGTACWLGIPEMGLAFIAAYAIWLNNEEATYILDRITMKRWHASDPIKA